MCSDVVIRAANLGKCYEIYAKPMDRMWQLFMGSRKQLYQEFWALRDASFEIKKGETIGIVGRNGSGKSTLLQLLCGTLTPTTGEIEVNGRVAALLELGAGFNPEFTGRENVYLNASIMGLSRHEINEKFASIEAFAEIGAFIDQPIKSYSSGMFVRLAFAIVAHLDADILVIDEALAVGDAFFTQKCMRFLRKFKETGTVVFVSHDSSSVINLCQRAIWLDKGCVQKVGTAKEVSESYLAAFFEAQQGASAVKENPDEEKNDARRMAPLVDQRLSFVNQSPLRNDIELFKFVPDAAAFGKGGGRITFVGLVDESGNPFSWIVGGEKMRLLVRAEAYVDINSPIIGFYIKDRLGQALFGDNTYLTYANDSKHAFAGEHIEAQFVFQMPILPVGEYTIAVALASGTQAEHVHHHWIHDAMVFKSHSTSATVGLVGIPMLGISLNKFTHDQRIPA
ncbi:MAG: ABC-type polysaccharide/polyol phosphate transport system, ATPase component [Herminiimonas sp.]|nr:ABC-type polysaccharide/polyol phosphate transport system, ATPase component [Herminiimonas sp.]